MAEKRKRRRSVDRLIASLIAKLPSPGEEWSGDKQREWLRTMEMALNMVYGNQTAMAERDAYAAVKEQIKEAVGSAIPMPSPHAFIIDGDGIARYGVTRGRIMPKDVLGTIIDLRGEQGDLSAITWADGSRGVTGLHLDISTAA